MSLAKRNRPIIDLAQEGYSCREIANMLGFTYRRVSCVLTRQRAKGALPPSPRYTANANRISRPFRRDRVRLGSITEVFENTTHDVQEHFINKAKTGGYENVAEMLREIMLESYFNDLEASVS